MAKLTHFDREGRARMVDVGGKPVTRRAAVASGRVLMKKDTLRRILDKTIEKGDVLAVAQVAGIMAAKRTGDIIPMCHPLGIDSAEVFFHPDIEKSEVRIEARITSTGKTGVEMEALLAVSTAALAIYDMSKAVEKGMVISDIRLLEKSGGKSGHYRAPHSAQNSRTAK